MFEVLNEVEETLNEGGAGTSREGGLTPEENTDPEGGNNDNMETAFESNHGGNTEDNSMTDALREKRKRDEEARRQSEGGKQGGSVSVPNNSKGTEQALKGAEAGSRPEDSLSQSKGQPSAGRGGKNRIKRAKDWLRTKGRGVGIILLQELRIKEELATRRLMELTEGTQFVIDYTTEGKAGAVVAVVRSDWKIVDSGVKGDGSVAWAKINTDDGIIGVALIHGPRERSDRKKLWEWLEQRWEHGTWIFGGDWNSVETPEDSIGESPVQLGAERRRWQSFSAHQDLEDGWLVASQREGPHFTRQQKVKDRLDQSRLDRIYFSRSEVWSGRVIHCIHDNKGRLSDHHPVLLKLSIRSTGGAKKGTYFKVQASLLESEEVKQEIQTTWKEAGIPGIDARRNWEWKWSSVRKLLRDKDWNRRKENGVLEQKIEELSKLKVKIAENRGSIPEQEVIDLEQEIKKLECEQEKRWRTWSGTRWIKEGEAPSKFFFAIMRTRRVKQEITALKGNRGQTITSEEEILKTVNKYYANLFQGEELTASARQQMDQVLSKVTKKVSVEQNTMLSQQPTEQEIQEII
ncbi:hypothetical protein R1sor_021689 [Riccia sorocarpa]|uniref:Endonuclease/exonuclease/phosphatase domain-containing protein n=1 Tax=Riccia sorocarpa TaxID=122646 RepID=A0ABD3GHS9_9MARC